jgi:ABC-type Fe3+/spermidine/putrescine transport system ATPase subunit
MGTLVLKNMEKNFDGKPACTDINLTINKGEFFTLLGPSGCGKTTTLRLIAGFITPCKGTIHLDGKDITELSPEERDVGMVFQNYALFPFLTVYENIEYGLKIQKKTSKEKKEIVTRYIKMIGLTGYEKREISELSGGEQQRVALARSLVVQPQILLLDEPLSNLDARLRDKMRFEIKSLQKKLGITTIFVTHDQTEALTMSDRIAVFDHGRIAQVGTPQEIYAEPHSAFVATFIGNTNLFEAQFTGKNALIANGELSIHVNGTPKKGKFISIRPQDIFLSENPCRQQDCNMFKGRLKEIRFNGIWIDHIVSVPPVEFQVMVLNTTQKYWKYSPDDEVFIFFSENSVKILSH